jgi:hypothetical protein
MIIEILNLIKMAITILKNQIVKLYSSLQEKFNDRNSDCFWHMPYNHKSNCTDSYQFEFDVEVEPDEVVQDNSFDLTPITGASTSAGTTLLDAGASFLSDSLEVGMVVAVVPDGAGKFNALYVDNVISNTEVSYTPPFNYGLAQGYFLGWWLLTNSTISGGNLTLTNVAVSGTSAIQFGTVSFGQSYTVTINVSSILDDVYVVLGANAIGKILASEGAGSYTFVGQCQEGDDIIFEEAIIAANLFNDPFISLLVLADGGTDSTVISSITTGEYTDFSIAIKDCDTDEVVFIDTNNDFVTLNETSALVNVDWEVALSGISGYGCPNGCYSIVVFDGARFISTDPIFGTFSVLSDDMFVTTSTTDLSLHSPEVGDGYTIQTAGIGEIDINSIGYLEYADGGSSDTYSIDYPSKQTNDFFIQFEIRTIQASGGLNGLELNWMALDVSTAIDTEGYAIHSKQGDILLFVNAGGIGNFNGVVAGDIITVTHIGTNIKVYQNDTLKLDITDSTYTSGQFTKMRMRTVSGSNNQTFDRLTIGEPIEGSSEVYESDCFSIQDDHTCTVEIRAFNDNNAFGFNFENQVYEEFTRVEGVLRTPKYNIDKINDIDSLGTTDTIYFQRNKVKQLFIYDIPEFILDGLSLMTGMDSFFIDNVSYEVIPGSIEPEPFIHKGKEYDHYNVTLEVVEKTENNKNRNC